MDKQTLLRQEIATGLLLVLLFSLALIALNYSVLLSLALGLCGSGAGVFILAWWYDDRAVEAPDGEQSQPGAVRSPTRRNHAPGVVEAQRRRREMEKHTRNKRHQQTMGANRKQRSLFSAFIRRRR